MGSTVPFATSDPSATIMALPLLSTETMRWCHCSSLPGTSVCSNCDGLGTMEMSTCVSGVCVCVYLYVCVCVCVRALLFRLLISCACQLVTPTDTHTVASLPPPPPDKKK